MNKNRTNLILIGALALLFVITAGFILGQNINSIKNSATRDYQKSMKNLTVKNDLQKYGVEVIPSTDFNFDAELMKYMGENEALTQLVNSAKPFAFFIKNNSSKEIVGISLRWKFTDSKGNNTELPQSEANPGVLMGIKPLDPKMVGKTSLINSKDMKFFTYFKDSVGQKVTFANLRVKNPLIQYQNPFGAESSQSDISNLDSQKEKILSGYADFSVSLDGIFFSDGTFVGDDQNFFFDTLRGDIEARKDILTTLAEAKSSGKANADILDDILVKTANVSANLAELRAVNVTREQVYDLSYKNYLKNVSRELTMKRSKMSDDYIVEQLQSTQVSDFVMLRKVED
ncbi:MAG TPA: hypothetical protein VGC97_23760 [Pyrinomonadaceae bacterium]|jgi:hypothetical protein